MIATLLMKISMGTPMYPVNWPAFRLLLLSLVPLPRPACSPRCRNNVVEIKREFLNQELHLVRFEYCASMKSGAASRWKIFEGGELN